MNGGEIVARVLERHGVRFLFTLVGGHISPILVEAKRRGIRVVDTRHEATAAFAADAVGRLTGVPGVAAVTAGPGVTNTVTAIKNAQMAQSPVVLLGGATATLLRGRGSLQDIDQLALIRPHVKLAATVGRLRDLAPALERAFATAVDGVPGPVFVEIPVDLLYDEPLVREWYAAATPRGKSPADRALRFYLERHARRLFAGVEAPAGEGASPARELSPEPGLVRRAADLLRRTERPVVLVGSQALAEPRAAADLQAALGALGAPVFLAGMARGLLGRGHPLQMRQQRKQALREADLVVAAGVPFDFRLDYGRQIGRRVTLIAANRSRAEMRKNRRPQLAVEGDAGRFLRALAAEAPGGERCERWESWTATLRARDEEREAQIARDAQAPAPDGKLNPLALCRGLEEALPERSVLVGDGGDFLATASYVVRPREPLTWLDPGVFGTLGCGAGFAIGAALCRPDHEVWVLWGDGAFAYSLAEYDTFVRHRLPILGVIGNDAAWMQIARDQVPILGDDVACMLAPSDYERAVEGLGARGFALRNAGDIAATLAAARASVAAGMPTLVNAHLGRSEFRKGSLSM
jgi:acetolactate synthase-1/2/3 large subunit